MVNKNSKKAKRINKKHYPTLNLKTERDIAMDFAQKVYTKFDKLVKSIILFGSTAKHKNKIGSDIDLMIVIDDASVRFDEKLIVWYREELGKIIQSSPYKKDLHINTVKLTTWWNDLIRGDPTIINIIRYGETLIDFGGFFNPLKILLEQGKIRETPEAIHTSLQRVPSHIRNSKIAEVSAIEGCYWAMVETAQAMLMTIHISPPSPEVIPKLLHEHFVTKKMLKVNYVRDFRELYELHSSINHGEIKDLKGNIIDGWQEKAEDFYQEGMRIIKKIID